MPRIALLSTSDTDLLSARASGADFVLANPGRASHQELAGLADADLIVARILGRPEDLCSGFRHYRDAGVPMVVVGGEREPSAELMEQSTVPIGVSVQAHRYLAEGGPANLAELHAFLSDTVLLTGEGFDEPQALPEWGVLPRDSQATGSRIGILFYKAHHASGNEQFVHDLADAVDATGDAVGVPIYSSSLRGASEELLTELGTLDALIVTVLAAGGTKPATSSAGGDDEAWDVAAIANLDIPVLQGLCLTWDRATWTRRPRSRCPSSTAGSSPRRSPSRRPTRTVSRATSPTRSAAAGSPARPRRTPGFGTRPPGNARSRWCCRRTRPSTAGSATPSAWTPRSPPCACSAPCAHRGTTSATSPASTCPTTPRRATP